MENDDDDYKKNRKELRKVSIAEVEIDRWYNDVKKNG